LFIFFLQAVPVKEIGKLLGKCQNTEEVHNQDDGGIVKEKKDDVFHFCQTGYHIAQEMTLSRKITVLLQTSEHLPDSYTADILTPPPNRC
jgi:hypothetical protein